MCCICRISPGGHNATGRPRVSLLPLASKVPLVTDGSQTGTTKWLLSLFAPDLGAGLPHVRLQTGTSACLPAVPMVTTIGDSSYLYSFLSGSMSVADLAHRKQGRLFDIDWGTRVRFRIPGCRLPTFPPNQALTVLNVLACDSGAFWESVP